MKTPSCILAIVLATSSSVTFAQGSPPILEHPPTRSVGDTFTYSVGGSNKHPQIWTYLGRNGDLFCYSVSEYSAQRTVCKTGDDNFVTDSITRIRLGFPLFVGKSWEYSFAGHPDPAGGQQLHAVTRTFTTKARVTAYEPVTVGAGTFDAFKIEAETIQWGESSIAFVATVYYSPKLGIIKRSASPLGPEHYFYDQRVELDGYTRGNAGEAR
jgi:hypothetical protein